MKNDQPNGNRIKAIQQQLLKAEEYFSRGDGEIGKNILEELLRLFPNYFAARTALAGQKFRDGQISEALDELYRALRLAPENIGLLMRIGQLEKQLGHIESAASRFKQVLGLDANDQDALWELAQVELDSDDIESSILHLKGICAETPYIKTCMADAYERVGQSQVAIALYEKLLLSPDTPIAIRDNAAVKLSALPSNIPDHTLLRYISDNISTDRRLDAEFAKGNILTRQGDFSAAWHSMKFANEIKWSRVRKAAEQQEASYPQIRDYCHNVSLDPAWTENPNETSTPIVICGPSRSGKSLAESLIAGFSGVCRGFESDVLAQTIAKASQEMRFPPVTDPWHFDNQGRINFSDSSRRIVNKRARGSQWLTLTSPANIFHVAAAAQMNENAVFVFVSRNRVDLMARIFASDYATGHSYSYNLASLNRYLDWHDGLMQCWSGRLKDRCVWTSYEELVSEPHLFLGKMHSKLGSEFSSDLPTMKSDVGFGTPFAEFLAQK